VRDRRNIRLLLAYDGSGYAGWQRQKKCLTIQGVLEEAIATMTREEITLHGAGRTDAGVHAVGMVANFTTAADIPCPGFLKGLNSILPPDIRILKAEEAEPGFHARRSAQAKTYCYRICNSPVQLPTDRLYSAHLPVPLDMDAIRSCITRLLGSHDFSSFEAAGSRDPRTGTGRGAVRNILAAGIEQSAVPGSHEFLITGDGFLRHMVRNIIGTLLEVGRGKITARDFSAIISARDRNAAGPTAPAHGLFLKKVHYESVVDNQVAGL